ncbi:MAG TPA: alpha/beta hydrolase [Candidatus Corynebacterium avicola]|uniref:Alpha/beta hydrolase n=1 Tax=Candidatus Corynebacterium avicola TaxID=2838527 RepID=A0A9D1UM26_9CORY|nr:alpha/beta hydrolase [Candidatus Corynebacterium avicola]
MSTGTTISLSADNGEPIVVTRRAPESADPRGAVIICPAIATPARFYDAVATWLASRGFLVYNFDYQGYGASARTALKDVTADYFTWAADAATVVDAVKDDLAELGHGTLPLTWLGHSLGSQYLGFTDTTKLDKAVITCGGTGWWQNSDPPSRYFVPLLWWVIAPVLSRTLGYFPGKKLRILGDIPGTVMLQWANFCRHREYLWDVHPEHVQTFADVTIPVTSITFSDDVIMSAKASEHLESYYTGTDLDARRYSPEELDRRSVNHMGLFRRGREDLWERLIEPELATVETR